MAGRYEFIPGLLPLVVMLNPESLEAEDIVPVFAHYRELAKQRVRFVSVTDSRGATKIPSARTRRVIGEESKILEREIEAWSLGGAIVLESGLMRGALTAIQWVSQSKRPMVYCATMIEAVDWAIGKLEADGLELTPAIREYRARLRK